MNLGGDSELLLGWREFYIVPDAHGSKFQEALSSLGITRVICIDDVYASRADIPSMVVWAGITSNHQKLNGILTANQATLQAPSDTFEAEFRALLDADESFAIKLQASIDRIRFKPVDGVQLTEDEQQLFTDRSVLSRLDELLEGFNQFTRLSPAEWSLQQAQILGSLSQESTLFIFDENLGQGIQSGSEQIRGIAGTPDGRNAYFGLLSYSIQTGQEHERTREFQAENIAATAIPKRDLTSAANIEFLQIRLRAAIMWKESARLRSQCKRAMLSAVRASEARVHALTPLEFDEVVFRSSYEEGVHEMDTLVRVYTNAFASQLRETLRQNQRALGDIDTLRMYRALNGKGSKGSETWRLQREEFYEAGSYVNGCRMPLDAGDIFSIVDAMGENLGEFVLLAPPCDLVIRSSGNSVGTRKVDFGFLCPLSIRPAIEGEKGCFELAAYGPDPETTAQVEMTKPISIELWLLDLCALNEDGQARICLNGKMPKHLSDGWKSTVGVRLAPKSKDVADSWKHWQKLDSEARSAVATLPAFRIPFKGSVFIQVSVDKPPRKATTVTFGVKRIHRLSADLAAELLQAFSDHLSRPARPHSLSRSSSG